MSEPTERFVELPAGLFRLLEWPGAGETAVFLHGLTGLASVWRETIAELGAGRPPCIALDQRGHGDSPAPAGGYAVGDFVGDTVALIETLGGGPVRLVGHSMGARVALVTAARRPDLVRSVAIIDIGPEAWKTNWRETAAAIDRMPASFTRDEAVAYFTRSRPTPAERVAGYLERLRETESGRLTWRGNPEAFKRTVVSHRSRNFWREWEGLGVPAMLVRGGDSNELRPRVAAEMRRRNPSVRFRELDGVGHNVPLLAPAALARELREFWDASLFPTDSTSASPGSTGPGG